MTTQSRRPRRSQWTRRRILTALAVLTLAVGAWLFWPFWQLSGQFGNHPTRQPSRLYGRPPVVEPGKYLSQDDLRRRLKGSGYVAVGGNADGSTAGSTSVPGTYREVEGGIEVHRRTFPSPRGLVGGDVVRITFRGRRVHQVQRDGQTLAGIWLDPPLVAAFYGPNLEERRPVALDDVPENLVLAVLAAEDAGFLKHAGVSVKGILRAAWANLRANKVRQGGSTLTQQLVKNLYLTHERRWVRKVREALLAVLLELRYDKRSILQAYLNEIYWGRSGSINLMGVGAASWAYFGKEPAQLTLGEAATLAGMIQSPANLSPLNHPEAAKKRRDVILGRLDQLRWVTRDRLEAAGSEPVEGYRGALVTRKAPYFADAMIEEARRRFGVEELNDAGYTLCSTLDLESQIHAEEAVGWGLEALKGWEKGKKVGQPLQAALVSLDPSSGGIRAYVGGRDYGQSQFDRARHARRQAGSAFKPIVYAAAFDRRLANPATFLEDAPYTVRLADRTWSPKNSDGEYHGWVTAREALEKSYNVPTARLAVYLGLEHVVSMAKRLGIKRDLKPFPALALGAMEVTPLELANVYATLAAGGVRHPPHGLNAVFDRQGRAVPGQALDPPERALDANVSFLITQILQGVLDRGTARNLRQDGFSDRAAGKTGTTNDRRDSWFAGYSPEHATLVWVGYDNNAQTRLSGARAALPIWGRFAMKTRPPAGYSDFAPPDGVVALWIDPRSGGQAHSGCSERRPEYFLRDFVPEPDCADDSRWRRRFGTEPEPHEPDGRLKRWLRMLRGRNGG